MLARIDATILRERFAVAADWLVIAIAASLPWSTTATAILIVLWLASLAPSIDLAAVYRECRRPDAARVVIAGALSTLLVVWAAAAMLWADAAWAERIAGLGRYAKLLIVTPILVQFHRSERGSWAMLAFLLSCTLLLLTSYFLAFWPGLSWRGMRGGYSVPIKDYILQSQEFVLCAFALLGIGLSALKKNIWLSAGMLLLAALFLVNVLYVVASRTALVVTVALLIAFAIHQFRWRAAAAFLIGVVICAWMVWETSPELRSTAGMIAAELQGKTADSHDRIGARVALWRQSADFIAEAPIFGHGTGSIKELFRRANAAAPEASHDLTDNPHNEIVGVAIQMGIVGVGLLCAMWVSHLLLFAGGGARAWIGVALVVQNIVSCLFNSHLTDFTQGWLYLFGLGVTAGYFQGFRVGARAHDDRITGRDAPPNRLPGVPS